MQQCSEVTELVGRPDTTVFSLALGITGIGDLLASGGDYTVLVPTDQALLRYLDDAGLSLEELTTVDTDELYELIASHILTGEALSLEDFVIGDSYTTLNDNKILTLRSSIEPITVEVDLAGCGALVHIVDYVVRPQTLTEGSTPPAIVQAPPEVVEAPAPVVVEAPAPVVVEAPAPVVVEAPAPEVVEAPAPEVVEAPAPVVVEAPAPVVVEASSPVVVEVPSPEVVEAPAPEVVEAPAPVVVEAPAPVVVEAPAPEVVEAPAPEVVEAPAPEVVEAPAPVVVEAPAPVVVEAPAPEVVEAPAPEVVEAPAPVVVEAPAPEVVEAPAPEVEPSASPTAVIDSVPESDLIPLTPVAGSPDPAGAPQQNDGDLIPLQPPVAIPVPAPSPTPTPQPAPPSCSQSVADVLYSGALGGDTNLSGAAADYVGLGSTLQGISTNEPYTIFVPTDAAWGRSGIDWDAVARDDPDKLLAVLLNHVIPGQSLQVTDFQVGSTYPTLNSDKLLKLDGPLDPVVEETVTVCNTVIHKISVVIVPDFVGPLPAASSASSASATSQQPTAASNGGGSSNQASSSVDIVDVSVGDNAFSSGAASWNGNSFSGSSGSWGDNSWSNGEWNWGGSSGSVNQINLG